MTWRKRGYVRARNFVPSIASSYERYWAMHMFPFAHGETLGGTTSLSPSPSVSWVRHPCGSENTRPYARYSASLVATGFGLGPAGWLAAESPSDTKQMATNVAPTLRSFIRVPLSDRPALDSCIFQTSRFAKPTPARHWARLVRFAAELLHTGSRGRGRDV